MADEIPMTKNWCDQVRHACASQVKERYDAMKELFLSKLEGISEQLEVTLQDLQKSLSAGSKRMAEIEVLVRNLIEGVRGEVKAVHERIDSVCKTSHDKIESHEVVNIKRFDDIEKEIKNLSKPPWQLISIIVMVLISVAGSMFATWRQVGVHDERFEALRTQIYELKQSREKSEDETRRKIEDLIRLSASYEEKYKNLNKGIRP